MFPRVRTLQLTSVRPSRIRIRLGPDVCAAEPDTWGTYSSSLNAAIFFAYILLRRVYGEIVFLDGFEDVVTDFEVSEAGADLNVGL